MGPTNCKTVTTEYLVMEIFQFNARSISCRPKASDSRRKGKASYIFNEPPKIKGIKFLLKGISTDSKADW